VPLHCLRPGTTIGVQPHGEGKVARKAQTDIARGSIVRWFVTDRRNWKAKP
jgi:hypothetical protein